MRRSVPAAGGRRSVTVSVRSIVSTLVAVLAIAAVVSFPDRMRAPYNEMRAVGTLRFLSKAQAVYRKHHGEYAPGIRELRQPIRGDAGPPAADLIPAEAFTASRADYNFIVAGGRQTFAIWALPVAFPKTGRRSFYTDETGVFRESWGPEPAHATSKELR